MVQAWRAFIGLLPLLTIAVVIATPVVILKARGRVRRHDEPWATAVATAGARASALLAALAVLALTLDPLGVGVPATSNWVPFATIANQITSQVDASVAFRNLGLNVLLFVPVGFAWTWAAVRSRRTRHAGVVAGIGLSALVETAQLLAPLGRAADVDDLILNSAGALLGAFVARALCTPSGDRASQPVGQAR